MYAYFRNSTQKLNFLILVEDKTRKGLYSRLTLYINPRLITMHVCHEEYLLVYTVINWRMMILTVGYLLTARLKDRNFFYVSLHKTCEAR